MSRRSMHVIRVAALRKAAVILTLLAVPTAVCADAPADCAQLQDLPRAIAACSDYIAAGNGSTHDRAAAHFHRGTAYGMSGQLDRALPDLDQAIELDPDWSPPYNNRARAYVGKGEPARAIPDYDKLLALKPDDAGAYVNRALAYLKMQDRDRALADLERAYALNPKDAFAIFNVGAIYEAKGDKPRAEAAYRKTLALAPGNKNVLDSLKRLGVEP